MFLLVAKMKYFTSRNYFILHIPNDEVHLTSVLDGLISSAPCWFQGLILDTCLDLQDEQKQYLESTAAKVASLLRHCSSQGLMQTLSVRHAENDNTDMSVLGRKKRLWGPA